jgi:hypothetical protein
VAQLAPIAVGQAGEALFLVCEVAWARGAWYGHVMHTPDGWAACIIYLSERIDAVDPRAALTKFDWLTRDHFAFEPCRIQKHDDAFALEPTCADALTALGRMAARFDLERRAPECGSPHAFDPLEFRVFDLYGVDFGRKSIAAPH